MSTPWLEKFWFGHVLIRLLWLFEAEPIRHVATRHMMPHPSSCNMEQLEFVVDDKKVPCDMNKVSRTQEEKH